MTVSYEAVIEVVASVAVASSMVPLIIKICLTFLKRSHKATIVLTSPDGAELEVSVDTKNEESIRILLELLKLRRLELEKLLELKKASWSQSSPLREKPREA